MPLIIASKFQELPGALGALGALVPLKKLQPRKLAFGSARIRHIDTFTRYRCDKVAEAKLPAIREAPRIRASHCRATKIRGGDYGIGAPYPRAHRHIREGHRGASGGKTNRCRYAGDRVHASLRRRHSIALEECRTRGGGGGLVVPRGSRGCRERSC
jgi:hypothetical protein